MTLNTTVLTAARWRRLPAPLRADLRQALGRRAQIVNHQVLNVAQALCNHGAYDLALALYETLQGEPPATEGCGFGMLWRLRELMGAEAGPDPTETILLQG